MSVTYTERALADLDNIADYFLSIGQPRAGDRLIRIIYTTCNMLEHTPFMGRRQNAPNVRKVVVSRTVYLVYYLVSDPDQSIFILSVQDGRRETLPFSDV